VVSGQIWHIEGPNEPVRAFMPEPVSKCLAGDLINVATYSFLFPERERIPPFSGMSTITE